MKESEWNATSDLRAMLDVVRGRVGDRKLRLFAAACCRQQDGLLFVPGKGPKRPSVDIAERLADGLATESERQKAWKKEDRQRDHGNFPSFTYYVVAVDSFEAAQQCAEAAYSVYGEYEGVAAAKKLREAQCQLMREIFGNPVRPVVFEASWRTKSIEDLARSIYESQEFDKMPMLWEKLNEAGCADKEIKAHCQGPGPHVRGCWVLDHCLGKE